MDKEIPPRGLQSSPVPLGMLGMLVAIAFIEQFVICHKLDLTHTCAIDWNLAGRRAVRETRGNEILCFGDSLMKHGALPNVIESRTGRRCYSLALAAGQAPADFFLLRRALESGSRPPVVLVDFKPNLLEGDYLPNLWLYQQLFSVRECWDFARATRDPHVFAAVLVGRLLPSIRVRRDIRGNLLAAFEGRSASHRETNLFHMRNWRMNRGGQLTFPNPYFQSGDAGKSQYLYLYNAAWKPSPVMLHYVHRFLRLAKEHEIQVYWLMPPFCPETRSRREQMGLETAYTRLVQTIQAKYSNLNILDGRRATYPRLTFIDPSHLDGKGGINLSLDVAEILQRRPTDVATPRWIELPAYRERTIDIPLEDTKQSFMAVKALEEIQRR